MATVLEPCVCGVCPPRANPTRCSLCERPHCLSHESRASARSACESCVRAMKTVARRATDARIAADCAAVRSNASGPTTRTQSAVLRRKCDEIMAPEYKLAVVRDCVTQIFGKLFTDGRNEEEMWIDCVSKHPMQTCRICFAPSLEFECNPFWTALGTAKCSMTGFDDAQFREMCGDE